MLRAFSNVFSVFNFSKRTVLLENLKSSLDAHVITDLIQIFKRVIKEIIGDISKVSSWPTYHLGNVIFFKYRISTNSFRGNYSIYEVKNCHAETIRKFLHFTLSKKIVSAETIRGNTVYIY